MQRIDSSKKWGWLITIIKTTHIQNLHDQLQERLNSTKFIVCRRKQWKMRYKKVSNFIIKPNTETSELNEKDLISLVKEFSKQKK